MCEFPALPRVEPKVRFLYDLSESENTGEEGSLVDCPSLYGHIPLGSESGTEACDESDSKFSPTRGNLLSTSNSNVFDKNLLELSGRSRAILKSYFLETDAFNSPRAHPTIAFIEPQVYHLLRVLSDETLNKSYATMERMVIDAVRGKPTTVLSRTAELQTRGRAKTPGRWIGLNLIRVPLIPIKRHILMPGRQAHSIPRTQEILNLMGKVAARRRWL